MGGAPKEAPGGKAESSRGSRDSRLWRLKWKNESCSTGGRIYKKDIDLSSPMIKSNSYETPIVREFEICHSGGRTLKLATTGRCSKIHHGRGRTWTTMTNKRFEIRYDRGVGRNMPQACE